MRSQELLSKEWCDLVFEGRNKAYGAYRLRRDAGRRYRRALLYVAGALGIVVLLYVAAALYTRHLIAQGMKEAQDAFAQMKASQLKEGYEVKFLATARMAPPARMAPGATTAVPEIVEGRSALRDFGFDGPIAYDPEEDMIVTPIVDTTGLHDKSLPVAKQKIVPTEAVQQMPEFPGGPRAFMQWLDQHIVYPQRCVDAGQGGTVELSFIVGTDGYATDFEVKNAFDPQVYRAALMALRSLPQWKPGLDADGQPTPVKITVPVEFKPR